MSFLFISSGCLEMESVVLFWNPRCWSRLDKLFMIFLLRRYDYIDSSYHWAGITKGYGKNIAPRAKKDEVVGRIGRRFRGFIPESLIISMIMIIVVTEMPLVVQKSWGVGYCTDTISKAYFITLNSNKFLDLWHNHGWTNAPTMDTCTLPFGNQLEFVSLLS